MFLILRLCHDLIRMYILNPTSVILIVVAQHSRFDNLHRELCFCFYDVVIFFSSCFPLYFRGSMTNQKKTRSFAASFRKKHSVSCVVFSMIFDCLFARVTMYSSCFHVDLLHMLPVRRLQQLHCMHYSRRGIPGKRDIGEVINGAWNELKRSLEKLYWYILNLGFKTHT